MAFPTSINDQITDSVTQVHLAGGDEALTVMSDLVAGIVKCLDGAKQGQNTMEEISVTLENAEVALHGIVARLASGSE
ncbi:MAG: hypothetical protein KZQ73_10250 [Candidatus Thiodiazotropha sp. (ex Semelilucina semeliformis)]|nr:hypothetical protein [Candidatus Thiodiazotropha sp. (ex Myrtea spinifera)]MCU7808231.1 hypothetical protein [Candidatus Thiodiazotropha sp. (ex Semelilucina semeliformis)]MCU7829744.1 hypothetical protein [Candidatus Thiodiazotropha sp. (ex Myrtea sp. 'scaly one' KF741663)]